MPIPRWVHWIEYRQGTDAEMQTAQPEQLRHLEHCKCYSMRLDIVIGMTCANCPNQCRN